MKSVTNRVIPVSIVLLLANIVFAGGQDIDNVVTVKVKHTNASKVWRSYKATLLKHLTEFDPSPLQLSTYGGRMDRQEKPTGFFHANKNANGWILVDPEGHHYLSVGLCSASPHDTIADHVDFFGQRFADRNGWARETYSFLIEDLKFNSLGCWSDWKAFKQAKRDIPYVRRWNLMATYARSKRVAEKQQGREDFPRDVLPVFDREFAEHCDKLCQAMKETRNDPWLIGHFSDNELPLRVKGILKRYLTTPAMDSSHVAAAAFLGRKGIAADAITRDHDTEFAELVLATYYRTVHDAIRKHDPNHMILGSRLHGRLSNQDICYTACGPFVDVVSINYYHRWTPDQGDLNRRADLARKPILITEWYAKAADSSLNNDKGAGFTVPTQTERAYFYENFAIGLLKNRNVVGWHWFRYIDDGDLKTKGQSSNKGIVDIRYRQYQELTHSINAINSTVYQLSDFLRERYESTQ